MRKLFPLFALVLTMSSGTAFAHGIWVAQRLDVPTIVYGHLAEDGTYDPAKVKTVAGYGADGATMDVSIDRAEHNVSLGVPDGTAVISTTFDNGFWIRDLSGEWQNVGKTDVPDGTESHQPLKFSTHILGPVDGGYKPTGVALEIVPLLDPAALHLGDDLPVQVLFDGKPFANAEVINDYVNDAHRTVEADAEGKVTLKVVSEGVNVLAVEREEPTPENPDVDLIYYNATLSFVLPHVE